ncbi:hypothetical protein KY092_08050 [Natronomonas gomsonensis]|uniref:hypothetical protein n=1 Tax=Natronomonas gomsonensis TaxID=1046043 RepID=UPI0020CA69F2|nr:hypothetical protein [Natronomonas gomsonensis]MCY4730509.1 hypothetical protein [Natronomonas gomsonensis]
MIALYLLLFHPFGTPESVAVQGEELRQIPVHYETDLEQGYCLFGEIEDDTAVVKEVVHTKYPIPWTNSGSRIDFTCIPEITGRLPELAAHNYSFIGAVHTHPSSTSGGTTEMSVADENWFKATSMFQRIHGIATEDRVSFYTVNDTEDSVTTLKYRYRGKIVG